MSKHLRVTIDQFSTAGIKQTNQDFHGAYFPREPHLTTKGIATVLADGISSSQVSQIASETAVSSFLEDYYSTSDAWSVKQSVHKVLAATNYWLFSQNQNSAYRYDKDRGYVCTFAGLVIKSNTAYIFHSGDSRIYRLEKGNLEQLTHDHRTHASSKESYLTRALGLHNSLDVDFASLAINEGDVFLLMTDGVSDFLSSKIIADDIRQAGQHLSGAAEKLINKALQANSDDNLTLQIVRIDELPLQSAAELQSQILPVPPLDAIAPRKQFDGYDIVRELYISSRSHVYLAVDSETKQQVVIKTVSTEHRDNQTFLENLLMEEWIAKRINNAHVLRAIDSRRQRNYLYTVTEFIEGKTLTQWMIDNPRPEIETVRQIIEQIAKGLQAFHRQEMVHQDLRPQNILIDVNGTAKVIDFGATKVAGINEVFNQNLGIQGTAQFTAPECFLGYQSTSQSDIFSLGVIAYQMLSGQLPYDANVSRASSLKQQNKLTYRSLSLRNKQIPDWVDNTISKAVSINPNKRYREVSEFIYDLRHPNKQFNQLRSAPLIERNPTGFWQGTSVILALLVMYLLLMVNGAI